MFRWLGVAVAALWLASCSSLYTDAKLGRISAPGMTLWVGEDKFVYIPGGYGPAFAFETAQTGRLIEPGMMYTDGGSIPRAAQAFRGFSPWGYGPAYLIHDWIFYGRHCFLDSTPALEHRYNDRKRFEDVNGAPWRPKTDPRYHAVEFHESATILAQAIKTLNDYGKVEQRNFAAGAITFGVDSPIALGIWHEEGACWRNRVEPHHIAIAWLKTVGPAFNPPNSWKLSAWEKQEARKCFAYARKFIAALNNVEGAPKNSQVPKGDNAPTEPSFSSDNPSCWVYRRDAKIAEAG